MGHSLAGIDYIPSLTENLPTSPRQCLACDKMFESYGKYNRICEACVRRQEEEGLSGEYYPLHLEGSNHLSLTEAFS